MSANEKGTKKFRISIIDILIVLVVVSCVAGLFLHYRIYRKNNEVIKDDKCSVSILLSGVQKETADKIAAGDNVYLQEDKTVLGKVLEVSFENAVYYYTDEKGIKVKGEDPYAKDVSVVVEVIGDLTEQGFLANGVRYVAAGMELDVYTDDFSEKGLIFGIEERSE